MKKVIAIILSAVMACCIFSGCASDSQTREENYQESQMQQANDQVGMPNITNFFEKKMAKQIFEKRDESNLICYAYTYSSMTGKYTYLGRCYGYGLPYSTEYTNPQKIEYEHTEVAALPQADPNGLYSSSSTAATWLMMIDDTTGEAYISYNEPDMTVSERKLPARLCETWSLPSDY